MGQSTWGLLRKQNNVKEAILLFEKKCKLCFELKNSDETII